MFTMSADMQVSAFELAILIILQQYLPPFRFILILILNLNIGAAF